MRKFSMVFMVLIFTAAQVASAVDIGSGMGISMTTEEFKPMIWLCDSRAVLDDDLEPGRVDGDPVYSELLSTCECIYETCVTKCAAGQASATFQCNGLPCEINFQGQANLPNQCVTFCEGYTKKFSCPTLKGNSLDERHNNYAFEGEKIEWVFLVMDKNKIEQIQDVSVTVGPKRSGRLEDFCALPQKNIVIDGINNEPAWGNFDYEVDVPGKCDYRVYLENDCDNLYAAFSIKNMTGCTPNQMLMQLNMTHNMIATNLLSLATEQIIALPTQEYKIPLSAFGARTGDTISLQLLLFENFLYPQTGFVSQKLSQKWEKRPVYNGVEVECVHLRGYASPGENVRASCEARISEEEIQQFDPATMAYYECTLTVEPASSMYGEHYVAAEAISADGRTVSDENEYWFFNPQIALSIDGTLDFGIIRPGTISYSETLLVENDADAGSGVILDMFISGTDFYDPSDSGARCVLTNRLKLGNNYAAAGISTASNKCNIGFGDADDHICYYSANGGYTTKNDPRSDQEGYAPVVYGDQFTQDFYNDAEIIQAGQKQGNPYWHANLLTPGADLAITFKLGLPEPCVGDFSTGQIYFWGEAV